MIIECYYCESKVDAKVLHQHSESSEEHPFESQTVFLECPACKNTLVGICHEYYDGEGNPVWGSLKRVWPAPDKQLPFDLPTVVRNALEEAHKCYKARAYRACAVMCGTALEGICVKFTSKRTLAEGLKGLLEKKVIDQRIYEWGETLRKHRNIGAHPTEEDISRQDASDLLEFTNAICDYIYVLSAKFEEFRKRQQKKKKTKKAETDIETVLAEKPATPTNNGTNEGLKT